MHAYKTLLIEDSDIVTLQEVKKYLKIDYDDEDEILKNCILSSIETAENFMNIALRIKHIEFNSNLGLSARISMPVLPIIEIDKVSIEEEELRGSYEISSDGQYLEFTKNISGKITVVYKAGVQSHLDVPRAIKQGILCHISEMYDKQVISGSFMHEIYNFYKPFRRVLI
jgi:hypothetical protein